MLTSHPYANIQWALLFGSEDKLSPSWMLVFLCGKHASLSLNFGCHASILNFDKLGGILVQHLSDLTYCFQCFFVCAGQKGWISTAFCAWPELRIILHMIVGLSLNVIAFCELCMNELGRLTWQSQLYHTRLVHPSFGYSRLIGVSQQRLANLVMPIYIYFSFSYLNSLFQLFISVVCKNAISRSLHLARLLSLCGGYQF